MKSFAAFLVETSASQQAQRLGLEGDGHGGWYDRSTGEFIAKTVKGTFCLLYTSPSPRDRTRSRMPSSA